MGETEMRKRILRILQNEAKVSVDELADRLGEAPARIAECLHAMEADKTILGYAAVINWGSIEEDEVTALIELNITPQRDLGFDDIARRLYSFDQVSDCYLMSGGYDLMLIVQGKSLLSVARFVSEKIAPLEAVLSTRTHFILKKYKVDGHLLSPEPEDRREAIVL